MVMDTLSLNPRIRTADGQAKTTEDPLDQIALHRIGFWSALATTLFGFGYGLAVILMIISNLSSGEAASGWQGIAAYQAAFRPILMVPLYPSLLLAPVFATLMVCVHYYTKPAKRIWSHIALVY